MSSMLSISNGLITGGTFIQNHTRIDSAKPGFERLQDVVASSAFHNSGHRFDPPRCHPNTRVAVIQTIMDWILGLDAEAQKPFILWLHGAAGSGKSAIAQTIAELCDLKGLLVASFFFSRTDPSRNRAQSLFPTIAYQMALALPHLREKLAAIIERDPLLFSRSLDAQFLALIVEPLRAFPIEDHLQNSSSPKLIIIDGLDECSDRQMQGQVLDVILRGMLDHRLPFYFLISSRPENDITSRFNSPDTKSVLFRLLLDRSWRPDKDIEIFIRNKFSTIVENHPFRQFIPTSWPTDEVISRLVRKSSGQFAYASTVMKYIESSRRQPDHCLDIILGIRPRRDNLPFAQLDALYMHVLSSAEEVDVILQVIGFHLLHPRSVDDMEKVLCLESGDIERLFFDMSSIVTFREEHNERKLYILHASLRDFLLDESRSSRFYIDAIPLRTDILRKCLRFLTGKPLTYPSLHGAHRLAQSFWAHHFTYGVPSAELLDDVNAFSIPRIYEQAFKHPEADVDDLIRDFNFEFLPSFFIFLRKLKLQGSDSLYNKHAQEYDHILRQHMSVYYTDMHLTLYVALIDFFITRGGSEYSFHSGPFHSINSAILNTDNRRLTLIPPYYEEAFQYFQLIHSFLTDHSRSGEYALDGEKYASASTCCLNILYDENSQPERSTSPPESFLLIRYVENASITEGVWNHSFVLEYLTYFLHRSGRSEELIKLCSRAINILQVKYSKISGFETAKQGIADYLGRMDGRGD